MKLLFRFQAVHQLQLSSSIFLVPTPKYTYTTIKFSLFHPSFHYLLFYNSHLSLFVSNFSKWPNVRPAYRSQVYCALPLFGTNVIYHSVYLLQQRGNAVSLFLRSFQFFSGPVESSRSVFSATDPILSEPNRKNLLSGLERTSGRDLITN